MKRKCKVKRAGPTDDAIADLERELAAVLAQFLQAEQADVQAYAQVIVRNYANALQEPDAEKRKALSDELDGQVLLLGEVARLRAANASFDMINKIIAAVLKVMLALAIAAI